MEPRMTTRNLVYNHTVLDHLIANNYILDYCYSPYNLLLYIYYHYPKGNYLLPVGRNNY